MHGTSFVQKYYTLVNEIVKMRKINSPQSLNIKYIQISSHYIINNSAYVIDHLHGASVKVNCPVGDLKCPPFFLLPVVI